MSPLLTKALLVIIPIGLYFQVMKPLYQGGGSLFSPEKPIVMLRQLSSEYDMAVVQAKDLSSQAAELKTQYKNLPEETKDRLNIMVPQASSTAADPVRLLDEVSAIIEQAGFSAGAISYREDDDPAKSKRGYILSFEVKGTYPKFKELLNLFESSIRVYTIESISFNAPQDATAESASAGLMSFHVVLYTYYIK